MYIGLALVAFYILIAGPVRDLIKNETTFTESLQNINGKLYILIQKIWKLEVRKVLGITYSLCRTS